MRSSETHRLLCDTARVRARRPDVRRDDGRDDEFEHGGMEIPRGRPLKEASQDLAHDDVVHKPNHRLALRTRGTHSRTHGYSHAREREGLASGATTLRGWRSGGNDPIPRPAALTNSQQMTPHGSHQMNHCERQASQPNAAQRSPRSGTGPAGLKKQQVPWAQ